MASQEKDGQYRRVYQPKFGVDYSAVLGGTRHIVRLETKIANDDWIVRIVATGAEWHINPKSLETAEPT